MHPELDALAPTPDEAEVVGQLLGSVDRLLRRSAVGQPIDTLKCINPELLTDLGELGIWGATLPSDHGGSGLSLHAAGSIVASIAQHDRSVATTVGLHLGLGTRGLVALGTPEQKARWMPDLATGATLAAFATTEAHAGSDLTAVRTTAVYQNDTFHISGEKIFVTNGGFAGLLTLAVATPGIGGRKGHSLFLVTPDDRRVTIGPEEHKLGIRGSSTVSVHLDDVCLPSDRLLGTPGGGMGHVHEILCWGRALMAAGCIGTARAALQAALAHTRERKQFGRTLAQMPVVQEQLATMAASIFAMEAVVRWAALSPESLAIRSLVAKVLCSELSWNCADMCLQLHGGSGFIEDTGIPLLLRDARIPRIFEGANDVLRVHLGLLEAGRPRPTTSIVGLRVHQMRDRLIDRVGVHLVRDPIALHRLGSAVVWRDALEAAGHRTQSAVATHALTLIAQMAEIPLRAPETRDTWRAAANEMLA